MPKSPPTLTDKQAEAWRLRHEEGLSYRLIGERMGTCKQTAIQYIRQVEKKLGDPKALVARDEGESEVYEAAKKDTSTPAKLEGLSVAQTLLITRLCDLGVITRMNGRDASSSLKNVTEVSQLLQGEPTQIVKIQDVRKLEEIGRLLHAEIERRGLMIDGKVEEVDR